MTVTAPPAAAPVQAAATGVADVDILDVTKRFADVTAVDRMTLSIARGTFYSLLGPSGCGKTTTLRMIAGFEQPTSGEILLAGTPVAGVPAVPAERQHRLPALRPVPPHGRRPERRLRAAPAQGRQGRRAAAGRRGARARSARRLRQARRTWELSGGQQQRVALARALVNRPTVLLLDEPLGALDLKLRKEMQLELKALQREVGITFVYVTHDQEEALTMSDAIVVMRDGLIQQHGRPTELYERPVNRFVANFIGVSNSDRGSDHRLRYGHATGHGRERARHRPSGDRHRPGRGAGGRRRGDRRHPARAPAGRARRDDRRRRLGDAGWTSRSGRVHQGTYLGDQTEYRVQTEQAGELIVRRQNAAGATASQGFGPGDPVVVRWHEDANLVLVH